MIFIPAGNPRVKPISKVTDSTRALPALRAACGIAAPQTAKDLARPLYCPMIVDASTIHRRLTGPPMTTSLKSLLTQNRLLRVFALCQLFSPKLVELIGYRGGFDAVWLDQEHVGLTVPQIAEAARAGHGGDPGSVGRLTPTDYAT